MPEAKHTDSTIADTAIPAPKATIETAKEVAMETKFELNESGRWEKRQVPVGVIGAGDILDELEKTPADSFTTAGYDQDYSYYFASNDPNHPSTQRVLAQGYAPHDGKPMRGHHSKVVPGWGPEPVIVCGDTVLVAVPRRLAEHRDERDRIDADRYATNRSQAIKEKGEQILNSAGLSYDDKSYIREARHDKQLELAGGSDADRATLMAESFARAAQYARQEDEKARGGQTFGGFRGNPEYNKAVPDSRLNIANQ